MGSKSYVTTSVNTYNLSGAPGGLNLAAVRAGRDLILTDQGSISKAFAFAVDAQKGAVETLQAVNARANDTVGQALSFAERSGRDALSFAKDLSKGPGEETSRYITLAALAMIGLVFIFGGGKVNA